MSKCGTANDHCCYFNGQQCQFLKEVSKPPYKWACSLREELGSWESVHMDNRYLTEIKPKIDDTIYRGKNCGDYPYGWQASGCKTCGEGV